MGLYLLTRQRTIKQHSQIKTEHCVSFRRSLSTLKLIWCVIYLASEKYTVSYAYFTGWKNQRIGCLGAPEAWGAWARARRAHWIRRHCPNPLSDRHQKLPTWSYVLDIYGPTHRQNLVKIPQGVSFPRMREIAHHKIFTRFFPGFNGPQLGRWTDFHAKYAKQRGSAQIACAFSGLENKKK